MKIQDVIFWVGSVSVYVVMCFYFLSNFASVMAKQGLKSGLARGSSGDDLFYYMVTASWIVSIVWGAFTVGYVISLQWIYHNIW